MSLNHVHISCPQQGCYAVVTVHPQEEDRLRRTGESFYCPAGHSMSFTPKSKTDERVAKLERDITNLRHSLERAYERNNTIHDAAAYMASAVQTCPLGCGWHGTRRARGLWDGDEEAVGRFLDRAGRDLAEHLLDDHNATRKPIGLLTAGTGEAA